MTDISGWSDASYTLQQALCLHLFHKKLLLPLIIKPPFAMSQNQKKIQFRHESDTWKRYLQFIQQENNNLKNRLCQVLQHDTDEQFLERAEYFQSKFIAEDDMVNMLRQDIDELDHLLSKEAHENGSFLKEVQKNLKKMQKDMEIVERQFSKLKSDFNLYLTESL